jgi:hypothetical protein
MQSVIKISLTADSDTSIFSTEKFTSHILGGNYLLNNLILLVIKISLTGDPDTSIFSIEKFTAHIQEEIIYLTKWYK